MPDCEEFAQQAFSLDYHRHVEWKINQMRYDSEFAIVHLPPGKDQPVDWAQIAEDEYDNRVVSLRILRHRAKPNAEFKAEEFKSGAMAEMAASGDVAKFRQATQRSLNSQK